jgi:tyrosine aminotransferase
VINPSNPCGSVFTKEHLREILDVASRNCVPIIADEIYEHFVFSGHEFTAISALSEDVPVLTCGGLTKRFLVPGWRMGWLIIHDKHNVFGTDIRKGIFNLASKILGPSTLIQRALPTILKTTPQSFFDGVILFIEVSGGSLRLVELIQLKVTGNVKFASRWYFRFPDCILRKLHLLCKKYLRQ